MPYFWTFWSSLTWFILVHIDQPIIDRIVYIHAEMDLPPTTIRMNQTIYVKQNPNQTHLLRRKRWEHWHHVLTFNTNKGEKVLDQHIKLSQNFSKVVVSSCYFRWIGTQHDFQAFFAWKQTPLMSCMAELIGHWWCSME